jgi:hypothetical protein
MCLIIAAMPFTPKGDPLDRELDNLQPSITADVAFPGGDSRRLSRDIHCDSLASSMII